MLLLQSPPPQPELPSLPHAPAAPDAFLPGPPWWHYALWSLAAFTLIALLVWLVRFFLQRQRQKAAPIIPPLQLAQSQLTALEGKADTTPLSQVAAQTSLILRTYLGQSYRLDLPARTEDELTEDHLAPLPLETRTDFLALSENLAEKKYLPSTPKPDAARALINQVRAALNQYETSKNAQLTAASNTKN